MNAKGKQTVSQSEISAALSQFLEQGGMIKQLPPQNFRASGTVGGEKYQAFEGLQELSALTGAGEQSA